MSLVLTLKSFWKRLWIQMQSLGECQKTVQEFRFTCYSAFEKHLMIPHQLLNEAQAPYYDFKAIYDLASAQLLTSLSVCPQGPTKNKCKPYVQVTYNFTFYQTCFIEVHAYSFHKKHTHLATDISLPVCLPHGTELLEDLASYLGQSTLR